MRYSKAGRLALVLGPAFLVAACGAECGPQRTTQDLKDRMQATLAPDIAAGRVTFEPLPDGARVTLLDPALFPGDGDALDDRARDVLGAVIQGLVNPSLLRIAVADLPAASDGSAGPRAQAVTHYFEDYLLGPALQPIAPQEGAASEQVGTTPEGVTIIVSIKSG